MKKILKMIGLYCISLTVMLSALTSCSSDTIQKAEFSLQPIGDKTKREIFLDYNSELELLNEMKSMYSSDKYELLLHPETLTVALRDLSNNEVYLTNPYNAASDPYYTGNIRKALESQIELSYATTDGKTSTLYSSSDCVSLGQYEVNQISKGISIVYSIGEEKNQQLVPMKISKADFEAILDKLSESNSRAVRRLKALYKEDVFENGEKIYTARSISDKERSDIDEYMTEAGYTLEDLEADTKKYGTEDSTVIFPNFQITLEYTVTDDGLSVIIPAKKIKYDNENFSLTDIVVLKYFGSVDASDGEDNEGYIFLPDGCGTIIDFNDNTENRQIMIAGDVYGEDITLSTEETVNTKAFNLPVYGLKDHNSGYFAIITEGTAFSRITGYAGSQVGEYFTAHASFKYATREVETLGQRLSGRTTLGYYTDDNYYTGNYKIQYYFLDDGNSSYMGMANIYRDFLQKQGMSDEITSSNMFLSLETLGTLEYNDSFLGVNYTNDAQLTTFGQNIELLQYFQEKGIVDINLQLTAWQNGGLNNSAVGKINAAKVLGGNKAFFELGNWCNENQISFYPDLDLLYVKRNFIFDDFDTKTDAAYLMNGKFAGHYELSPITGKFESSTFKYVVAPTSYNNYLEKFVKSYKQEGLSSFGLGTVGENINSNYRDGYSINREQSLELISNMLKQVSKDNKIMVNNGNAYTLPYAKFIKNIPLEDSGYRGTQTIPFMQLVLNGYLDYSSSEFNSAYNTEVHLLNCIESRTAPQYILAKDNTIKIKLTEHTEYYSINSEYLCEEAVDIYKRYIDAVSSTEGAVITEHSILSDGVVKVKYSNDTVIYVNYSSEDYIDNGITVPANDSLTIGWEDNEQG